MVEADVYGMLGASCLGCGKAMKSPMRARGVTECSECQVAVLISRERRRRDGVGGMFESRRALSFGRRRSAVIGRKNG